MRITTVLLIIVPLLLGSGAFASYAVESSSREEQRDRTQQEQEVEEIRRAAAAEAEKEQEKAEQSEEKIFKSGNLGLQKLNPEISVIGDMLGTYRNGDDQAIAWDTGFRGMGVHFESYLDPYSRFKAAVGFSPEEAELEEVYFTRYGFLRNTNLTLGKFRQQFGVVNRWHKHGLDWFDFPLALRSVFGPGGLNQMGLSFETSGSTGQIFHGLIVEVTDGDNLRMFGRNSKNRPSILANYKAYRDLSPSTYLEFGLTGLTGWNDTWTVVDTTFIDTRTAAVYGADLSLLWEPTGQMRYRNLQWRSEAYFVDKEIEAPDGSGTDNLNPWGFYSTLHAKVSRTVEIGVRYDYFQPDVKEYAVPEAGLSPLAVMADDPFRHLASVWLTWWQSPFVKFRGGYTYETTEVEDSEVHSVTLQMVFAAGPHKHERY